MKIDIELLKEFERTIDTLHPETGKIPIKILGFGEISLVFEIIGEPEQLAYKRIPIFDNEKQVRRHIWAYNEYCRVLEKDIGLILPAIYLTTPERFGNLLNFYPEEKRFDLTQLLNEIESVMKDLLIPIKYKDTLVRLLERGGKAIVIPCS